MAPAFHPVALVTGASRGIGRAIALQLAARGLRLAVHYRRNRVEAEATLATLPGTGHGLFSADLTVATAAATLMGGVLRAFGRIDVLVNNAGIYELHVPGKVGFAEWQRRWDRTLSANLTAAAHLSFLAARAMRRTYGGRIVNISSRGAFRGEARAPAYAAAKAGLNAFGQSLAKAFAAERVLVFTLAPGWVDTDMAASHLRGPRRSEIVQEIPLGRVATAEEVGRAAAWLALDAPESMTGCIIDLNGASYLRP
ncbi:MAG TPA: SDR family oxidoreductase [Opitutaceae bacterium]|nr:SDR family oxidoreductase [Opitutaceae bacterium]